MGTTAAAQYWTTWNANMVTEADFARMHGWGVNTLRISINYHWLSPSDGVYLDSGWAWLDQMGRVGQGARHLPRAVHARGAGRAEPRADGRLGRRQQRHTCGPSPPVYQPWATHLWTAIAQRYANETTVAGYDLLDEPLLSETNPASGGSTIPRVLREAHRGDPRGRQEPHRLRLRPRLVAARPPA